MNYKLWFVLVLQLMLAGCATVNTGTHGRVGEYVDFKKPKAQKVVLVVLENTNTKDALNQPFLGKLAKTGAYFSNYYAVAHPSQPNYFALLTGRFDDIQNGDKPVIPPLTRPHLGKLLTEKSLTWKVFAEEYKPKGHSCEADNNGAFVLKHVPFLSFYDVQREVPCTHVADFDRFLFTKEHFQDLPNFSLVIPNLNHDAHDQPLWDADDWLKEHFATLLENPDFKRDVIFIVTFDENGTKPWNYKSDKDNRVYTVMLGDDIKADEYGAVYNHYDLLRTIEEIFGLKPMAQGDGAARAIGGIWK
jgi:acid phosphatase